MSVQGLVWKRNLK